MSYQALYRRLRPQKFEDVIGQKHIIRTLKNQIETGRINHAYLFCGTRGTGKTTTAKIFARAINCQSDTTKPCNECKVCEDILSNKSMNVIEIDAASNNGVENIREIIDSVKYPPTEGKYKVYIIDEVHMLSVSAFNAFLKTLEEPPEYVVFILATTDPQKLPVTVLSRCQRFDFHRITKEDMSLVLMEYMKSEGKVVENDAIEYIAEVSDGAMRDALSILDQCLSFYYDKDITLDMVRDVLGSVSNDVFFEMCDAMNYNETGKCLDIINKIALQGRDIIQFSNDMISHFRNLLLAVTVENSSNALNYSDEYIEKLRNQGKDIGYEYLLSLINEFSALIPQLKQSFNPRMLLEVCCVKCCNPVVKSDIGSLMKRLKNIEALAENGELGSRKTEETEENANDIGEEEKIKAKEMAIPKDIKEVCANWRRFVNQVSDGMIKAHLKAHTRPSYLEDEVLTIVCSNNGALNYLDMVYDNVKSEIEKYFNKEFNIKLVDQTRFNQRNKELYGFKEKPMKKFEPGDFDILGIKVNIDYN
ncbi:MAG: DNA polymerase III subunit gamma/tau [Lachnospirales bacterium]